MSNEENKNAFTFLGFFVQIPAYHFGVVERFGKRTGGILREGLKLKLPFIDQVELISLELETIPISVEFTTKDKLKLVCSGSLQYRPDPEIKKGRNIFVEMSEKTITVGIIDMVKSKLGSLGGVKESNDFIENRAAIADLINCSLRLKKAPHLDSGVNIKKVIDFYKTNWQQVKKILNGEKARVKNRSSIEERYGIDIEQFALASIVFTPETEKSFEKEKQAEARARAFDKKMEMAKKAKELGASAQEALNAADVSLDSAKKEVISVEGQAGVLGGLLGKLDKGGK